MKESIEALNRNLLIIAMKTLLFCIPIFLITNKAYMFYFGDYTIHWDMQYILNFFAHEINKWIFSFIFFSFLFFISYSLEKIILPFIVTLIAGKIEMPKKSKIVSYKVVKKIFNDNPFLLLPKTDRIEIISHIMFVPVTLFLWLIYINNIWSYISMIIIVIIFSFFFKVLNSLYHEYRSNN